MTLVFVDEAEACHANPEDDGGRDLKHVVIQRLSDRFPRTTNQATRIHTECFADVSLNSDDFVLELEIALAAPQLSSSSCRG